MPEWIWQACYVADVLGLDSMISAAEFRYVPGSRVS